MEAIGKKHTDAGYAATTTRKEVADRMSRGAPGPPEDLHDGGLDISRAVLVRHNCLLAALRQ
jgi:hypothetical protein